MGKPASDVMAEVRKITITRHIGIKKITSISTPKSSAVEAKPVGAATAQEV